MAMISYFECNGLPVENLCKLWKTGRYGHVTAPQYIVVSLCLFVICLLGAVDREAIQTPFSNSHGFIPNPFASFSMRLRQISCRPFSSCEMSERGSPVRSES